MDPEESFCGSHGPWVRTTVLECSWSECQCLVDNGTSLKQPSWQRTIGNYAEILTQVCRQKDIETLGWSVARKDLETLGWFVIRKNLEMLEWCVGRKDLEKLEWFVGRKDTEKLGWLVIRKDIETLGRFVVRKDKEALGRWSGKTQRI